MLNFIGFANGQGNIEWINLITTNFISYHTVASLYMRAKSTAVVKREEQDQMEMLCAAQHSSKPAKLS